jgi:O-acetyl-ADP-ribose deacetylase (regulator of RNase III)
MEIRIKDKVLQIVKGDITREETEAIVNAANSALRGGAGVDGAIHAAGGPAIMAECRRLGGCPVGQAVLTGGGNLKAKYVIHTVGPVYRGGQEGEEALLASAFRESLRLAQRHGIKSLSFPAISTGVYGYPKEEAARTGIRTIIDFLKENEGVELVRLVLFDETSQLVFIAALEELLSQAMLPS